MTKCTICSSDISSLSPTDLAICKISGLNPSGYKCDKCCVTICLKCYMNLLSEVTQGYIRSVKQPKLEDMPSKVNHVGCGGTFC